MFFNYFLICVFTLFTICIASMVIAAFIYLKQNKKFLHYYSEEDSDDNYYDFIRVDDKIINISNITSISLIDDTIIIIYNSNITDKVKYVTNYEALKVFEEINRNINSIEI